MSAPLVIDRLLFGDNQFFGVNHMSEGRAQAQSLRFRDASDIIEVLDVALDEGIRTFMCTTHDRLVEVCVHLRSNPEHYRDFVLFPCMPYAHKYNNGSSPPRELRRPRSRGVRL
jgi:hypothetical protein